MARWLIPALLVEQCECRAAASFVGAAPFSKPGFLTLYDKNSNTNWEFANPVKIATHHAYAAERDAVPPYFSKVILPWP